MRINLEENPHSGVNTLKENIDEEYTPRLFSDDQNQEYSEKDDATENNNSEQLFDQDVNEDEDFEIPAFLRRQKF